MPVCSSTACLELKLLCSKTNILEEILLVSGISGHICIGNIFRYGLRRLKAVSSHQEHY